MATFLVHFVSLFLVSLWVGGGAALAFIAAPAVFEHASSRNQAGDIVGRFLRRFDTYALIAGPIACLAVVIEIFGTVGASRTLTLKLALVIAMVALAVYSRAAIAPEIRRLRAEMGEVDKVPREDPRRRAFGRLHGFSVLCLLGEMVLGALVLGVSVMMLTARAP